MEGQLTEFTGELTVNYEPAKIDFVGFDDMKAQVDALQKEYAGYEVTPQNYQQSKKERARLNNFKNAINDRKKEVVSDSTQRVSKFETQVKSLMEPIQDAANQIGVGIKQLDARVKQDKHERNLKHIEKMAAAAGVDGSKVEFNPKWDNKSYNFVTFEKEVSHQLSALQEQAKQHADDVKVVINKGEQLHLPASEWINQLDYKQLSQVLSAMDMYAADLAKQAEISAEHSKQRLAEQEQLEVHGDRVIDKDTGEIKEQTRAITLKLTGTRDQLTRLYNFIKDNEISYERA